MSPARVLSLVLCGNQPYGWNLESPTAQAVAAAIAASREDGMKALRRDLRGGARLSLPRAGADVDAREDDAAALEAARRSAQLEGPVSRDLTRWRVPCLICAGEADEMHNDGKRAAAEIPSAKFVPLADHSHISAFYEADDVLLPHILELLRSPAPKR